jgi:hypothetical protein
MNPQDSLIEVTFLARTSITALAVALFILMLAGTWLGQRLGRHGATRHGAARKSGISDIEAAMFALMGLILAFTFGMSGQRFDTRRQLIVNEANHIGTAILRADLYPESARAGFRRTFKEYLETRIAFYEVGSNLAGAVAAHRQSESLQRDLWEQATRLSRDPTNFLATMQMIPALNEMFDIVSSRLAANRARVPEPMVWLLFVLAIGASLLSGYNSGCSGSGDWLASTAFCALTAAVIFVTIDLDRPRRGLVRLDAAHQSLVDLRGLFSNATSSPSTPTP